MLRVFGPRLVVDTGERSSQGPKTPKARAVHYQRDALDSPYSGSSRRYRYRLDVFVNILFIWGEWLFDQ